MDMALDKIVPEDLDWLHTDEGPECVTPHESCLFLMCLT